MCCKLSPSMTSIILLLIFGNHIAYKHNVSSIRILFYIRYYHRSWFLFHLQYFNLYFSYCIFLCVHENKYIVIRKRLTAFFLFIVIQTLRYYIPPFITPLLLQQMYLRTTYTQLYKELLFQCSIDTYILPISKLSYVHVSEYLLLWPGFVKNFTTVFTQYHYFSSIMNIYLIYAYIL